ncbi:MAG: hypothetical protein M3O50_17130 [Myxococcota bacterium]|nr:hypothetical protein [Myxococcota bacterium]
MSTAVSLRRLLEEDLGRGGLRGPSRWTLEKDSSRRCNPQRVVRQFTSGAARTSHMRVSGRSHTTASGVSPIADP